MAILLGAVTKEGRGEQGLWQETKFMRQAMPLNSNENESDNEMHFTAAGGCAAGQEERGAG